MIKKTMVLSVASILLAFNSVTVAETYLTHFEDLKFQNPSEFNKFQNLAKDSLDFRARAYQFAQAKALEGKESIQLTREESDVLYDDALKYISLREKLLGYVDLSKETFEFNNDAVLTTERPTQVEENFGSIDSSNGPIDKTFYVNPLELDGQRKIREIELGLAASLMLMDNYILGIMPFHGNKELDYLLNYDTKERKVLQKIVSSYASANNRGAISKAIRFIDSYNKWANRSGVIFSKEEDFAQQIISSSTWYLMVKNNSAPSSISDSMASVWANLTRKGHRIGRIVTYGLSMGFGNLVGLVSSRDGLLTKMSSRERESLAGEMQPLDILMEKTPFRLTDKMIPGHYGHVAIWIGNEEQLKDLEVWDKIPSHIQEKIKTGHHIVEALRPGVQINTLEHFLNIDDLLVVRERRNVSKEYKQKLILTAIAQIGKEYDFNFDVNTHERIVCSEIAYVVYSDVKWPIEKSVGRFTISPDNVVQLSVGKDRIFEPVILYYKGQRYYKELAYSVSLLLKSKAEYYAAFEKFQADR